MSARALHRLFLIACSALLLVGCGLRFAYSQLDWLLPWYLRDYVTLDAGQRGEFDRRLAGLLDWHCRSHLPEYVALLRAANATLAAERVEPAQLERFLERGEALWREIVGELEPELRRLAAGLGDEQVEELAAAFVRRGEEARAEFLSGDESAQHAARVERMEERLRRWFGRMTPAQRERIAAWSRALQPTTEAWLEDRMRWQAELLDALRVRADAAAFPRAWRWCWRRVRRSGLRSTARRSRTTGRARWSCSPTCTPWPARPSAAACRARSTRSPASSRAWPAPNRLAFPRLAADNRALRL
ncbi:MAG TPA: DUF6279 family lipoprotein, partial [Thauera aminoaromatica]|nr:DUF6279 family lipoprotein [Thauera aminoaromatica]